MVTTDSARGGGHGFHSDDATSIDGTSTAPGAGFTQNETFLEDEEHEWENLADEIFKGRKGEEQYEKCCSQNYKVSF